MLPLLDPITGCLPPGEHRAGWEEFVGRFGGTPVRQRMLGGLAGLLGLLAAAGCRRVYVDGSFVTAKMRPRDIDACWDSAGVDLSRLDARLLDDDEVPQKAPQRPAYLADFFIADAPADGLGLAMKDFFQTDRDGRAKGIVVLDPQELPK